MDDHHILYGQLNRQLRRLGATENAIHVVGGATKYVPEVGSVRQQPSVSRLERCLIDSGYVVRRRASTWQARALADRSPIGYDGAAMEPAHRLARRARPTGKRTESTRNERAWIEAVRGAKVATPGGGLSGLQAPRLRRDGNGLGRGRDPSGRCFAEARPACFSRLSIEGDLSPRTMRDRWRKRDRDHPSARPDVWRISMQGIRCPHECPLLVMDVVRGVRERPHPVQRARSA
jgi:hypothetical protein